ncbi:hypothetical protein BDM02DRAFT_3192954 [Thelephora ganbajun]|uniref:Uncharacterized protein n=1 Tax=Thelephora ganbajun TaxID=370292 RepID=A0ACB6YZ89_THEGA|nr:hypothetical protein BDM02DRAFT_3192954 [Thelephora ganbajun]
MATGFTNHNEYYVVSKGLYVGIFSDWDEVRPWVTGVSGSLFRKARSWEEARDLYNAHLVASAIQILF